MLEDKRNHINLEYKELHTLNEVQDKKSRSYTKYYFEGIQVNVPIVESNDCQRLH